MLSWTLTLDQKACEVTLVGTVHTIKQPGTKFNQYTMSSQQVQGDYRGLPRYIDHPPFRWHQMLGDSLSGNSPVHLTASWIIATGKKSSFRGRHQYRPTVHNPLSYCSSSEMQDCRPDLAISQSYQACWTMNIPGVAHIFEMSNKEYVMACIIARKWPPFHKRVRMA